MKRLNVLVFPCGAENGCEIAAALGHSLHVRLYGASSVDDHGRFAFANYVGGLPMLDDLAFDPCFAALVRELAVDLVFATHDTVQAYLAPRAEDLGFHLVNGNPETARVTRRKSLTHDRLGGEPWLPRRYAAPDAVDAWPVVVKPDLGQGGQGVIRADHRAAAEAAWQAMAEPVIFEYLPGEEITVDCFTDRQRRLIWVGPRTRERVRAGISMRSRHLPCSDEIRAIAATINQALVFRGPWFFQLKRDRGGAWRLLEVCARVAGTMVAQRACGVNLPLMAVQDYLGRDLVALPEPRLALVERRIHTLTALDYAYDTVYVDLDDTLVRDGRAVPHMVAFLYRMVGAGKRLVLLTRHTADVGETLAAARLSLALFDQIIVVLAGAAKSAYITPPAIFIDNHFPERLDVARNCGIPVFDVDAVELLTP